MKYIIDIPDDRIGDFVGSTHLLMPYFLAGHEGHHDTGLALTPYDEPDRKGIEDEVWEFVRGLLNYTDDDWEVITNMLLLDIPYQEAKSKYEAWLKQKDEIHVGDEVGNGFVKGTAFFVDETMVEGFFIDDNEEIEHFWWNKRDCKKTGRHFDEVAELLEKMRGEE